MKHLPRLTLLLLAGFAVFATPLAYAAKFVVDDLADVVDIEPGDGICAVAKVGAGATAPSCTLRAAIQEANATLGADEITLPAGTLSIALVGTKENAAATGDFDITESLTITGAGIDRTVLNGALKDRLFDIIQPTDHSTVEVSISGMTIKNGLIDYAGSRGGAIYNDAHLTVHDALFTDNAITGDDGSGGALCNDGGMVDMHFVRFNNNRAQNHAGAVCNLNDGIMTVTDVVFEDNTTIPNGVYVHRGGAVLSAGTFIARNAVFSKNYSVFGGALYLEHGSAVLINAEVKENTSYLHGGGVHVGSHDVEHAMKMPVEFYAVHSTFALNAITVKEKDLNPEGAGLYVTGGSNVVLESSTISDNDAKGGCFDCTLKGGGISVGDGDILLNRVVVARNKAALYGGGIYVANNKDITDATDSMHSVVNTVRIIESQIIGNSSAEWGGGIAAEYAHDETSMDPIATVEVSHSLIADNVTDWRGAGVVGSINAINTTISGNRILGNSAFCGTDPVDPEAYCGKGAGIYIPDVRYVLSLTNVTLANNQTRAPSPAGGVDIYNRVGAPVTVTQSIIGSADEVGNCFGPVQSGGYNVGRDESCVLTNEGDVQGVDPALTPLAANDAGTRPLTHALGAASPALDLVPKDKCPQFDQRLFVRAADVCDAGAYEAGAAVGQLGEIVVGAVPVTVAEGARTLDVTLERTGGTQGEVTVEYRIRPSTATLGVDGDINIAAARGTLTWKDGDAAPQTLTVEILDDDAMEMDEHFTVEFFSPVIATLSDSPQIHVVTIPASDHPNAPTEPGTGAGPSAPTGSDSGGGGGAVAPTTLLMLAGFVLLPAYRRR